ncbi:hypothetical protein [Streptomyces sp. NPDC047525]|uniref:hypothetical protein n=1 Tax=Streptomyces sp. NPDC047525 TaxID=3155264 RepID=UPI0033F83445
MSVLSTVSEWTTAHLAVTSAVAGAGVVLLGLVAVRRLSASPKSASVPQDADTATRRRKFSAGTLAATVAFVVCTSVSLNTSFRFTADGLGMTGTPERVLSCAAFESLLAMCVLGARERMADPRNPSPGWYGGAVWIFAALSAVPAWQEGNGWTTGTAFRIIIGSFGSALAAHSALGLELKHRSGDVSQAPLAQISRDLRERLMARMGLAQRGKTAQEITQARALDKAVDLADRFHRLAEEDMAKKGPKLARDLAKAQDRAGVGTDAAQTELYRARVAQRMFATALEITPDESPWHIPGPTEKSVRHIESLAAQAVDVLAAHVGTPVPGARAEAHAHEGDEPAACVEDEPAEADKAAAAHGGTLLRVDVRVPQQPQYDQADAPEDVEELSADLASYETKARAAQALYRARIHDDGTRTTNAVAQELTTAFREWFGEPYDRGAANKAISGLRPTPVRPEWLVDA